MPRLYALLVAINDYPPGVESLQGCVNDSENVRTYLNQSVPDAAVLMLKNQEATHDNIIAQFRAHLGQAGKDDVALFHFCGHGSTGTSAPDFHEFDPSGRDQSLVCYDSRLDDDHYDLADKELARLIEEVAAKAPHIALLLDCCHSGSASRDLDGSARFLTRNIPGAHPPRPLETYVGGYYSALRDQGKPISVPISRHILLAACDRSQKAKEDLDNHSGIFTTALMDVLRKSHEPLSYADLFVRSRSAVRRYVIDHATTGQDPQFETLGGFDAYSSFLGLGETASRRSYSVYSEAGVWRVDCGAVDGISTDPAVPVELAVYPEENGASRAGTARTLRVGAQRSDVALGFESDPAARYAAEVISLPAAPLMVAFEGEDTIQAALQAALEADPAAGVVLTAPGTDDGYRLVQQPGKLLLEAAYPGAHVRSVALDDADWPNVALRLLRHVATWQRTLALDNKRPRIDPALLDFVFAEDIGAGAPDVHDGPDLTLGCREVDGALQPAKGKLQLRNRTAQPLHFLLLNFPGDYGVRVVANDEVPPGGEWMTIIVGDSNPSPQVYFSVDGKAEESVERLKLIVSTEPVDDFQLELDPLASDRGFGSAAELPDEAAKPVTDDWFVKDMRVRVTRPPEAAAPASNPAMPAAS